MTELSDAHPTLSDEKSSFTLSDAQPELCVVTLSHCDSLSTCARLLLANQHWRGISAQDSTWRALCKVVARDALLVFEPDQLLSTHGSYRAAARWLHGLRHTFKRPVDGEAAAHVEPKFSIKVGVRFRPHGTAAEQPAEAASAEQPVSSDRVVLPLHQRLQLLQQAHDCSASEARRRLWASAANSDPWASAACADKENNAVAEPPQPAAAAKGEEEAAGDDDAAAAAAPGVAANAAGLLSLQPHAPGAPGAVTLVCPAPKGIRHFGFDYAHAADASQAEVYAAAYADLGRLNPRSAGRRRVCSSRVGVARREAGRRS